jgi:hypothetical protein
MDGGGGGILFIFGTSPNYRLGEQCGREGFQYMVWKCSNCCAFRKKGARHLVGGSFIPCGPSGWSTFYTDGLRCQLISTFRHSRRHSDVTVFCSIRNICVLVEIGTHIMVRQFLLKPTSKQFDRFG